MSDESGIDDGRAAVSRDRLTRWRLVLGGGPADGIGAAIGGLGEDDRARDDALAALYDGQRNGGLGASSPRVARWLGDIRRFFPSSVVRVMQSDAMTRLGLRELLLEPELLRSVQPDLGMVTTLMSLNRAIPESSKETAREVVSAVTRELEQRLRQQTVQAVTGALNRAQRIRRPRHSDIDWRRTIAANLRTYRPETQTVIPERLVGYGRRTTRAERRIVLCIDQSGSMASSIVYSSVFGAVLASLRSVDTRMVVFDTAVVDLTEELDDPVDVLFGVQLGGGTDINGALAYCETLIEQPSETVLVLISDLIEGGITEEMIRRAGRIVGSGATMVALLALSDEGAPSYDAENAAALAALGVPAFACTPDLFPDLMAAAIERRDLGEWASTHDVTTAAPTTSG